MTAASCFPGQANALFQSRPVDEIVGGGPIGTGDFVAFPISVLLSDSGPNTIAYETTEIVSGRRLAKYVYRVPALASHYSLETDSGYEPAAYAGYFLIDEESAELTQLEVEVNDPPSGGHILRTRLMIEYQSGAIGGTSGMILPRRSKLIILLTSGAFSENVTEYGECRKFSSESILRFDAPSPKPSVQTKVASPSTVLRPGLEVETELISLVDSEHASTGDAIEARVTRAVKDRGAVVIPAGTRVSGRIIFERRNWFPDQSFWISFRLDQIELAGQWLPVRLAPARPDNADLRLSPLEVADLKHSWSPTRSERMTLVFQNRKGVRLGKGTLWRWETR